MTLIIKKVSYALIVFALVACQPLRPEHKPSQGHIQRDAANIADADSIPKPVDVAPALPKPEPQKKSSPRHTVVVHQVPVHELLFSLARDAKLNLDLDENVEGVVTLNAINQPLDALLDRIAESSGLTYDIRNDVLRVKKDIPELRYYRVDYLNMSRKSESSASVSTQISATGSGAAASGASSSGSGNNSLTRVTNASDHDFWRSLTQNIEGIIHKDEPRQSSSESGASEGGETSASEAAPSESASNPHIIVNKESGVLGVRATSRQHKSIQKFIDEILFSTQRQVLIEATIAEVKLSDGYQAGIDWSLLDNKLESTTALGQAITDIALFERPTFQLQWTKDSGNGDSIQSTLSALETFGDVSIMSSPKVMALNNQTALLKVVDNLVYFTIEVNIEPADSDDNNGGIGFVTYETEINTVPVGFVMSVTPFINEGNEVTLNVRPTISRVIRQARDPNPALAQVGVISEIPVIQVREVESVLKVESGNVAVIGGLMQDEISKTSRGVPILSRIPYLGSLFRYDADQNDKTELVIFIRPVVIRHASIDTELNQFKKFLPPVGR